MKRKPVSAVAPTVLATLLAAASLAACGRAKEPAHPSSAVEAPANVPDGLGGEASAASSLSPLTETQWRLVQFQSMDDSIGTVRPQDPSLYTMRLHSDGAVTMRLNCNHATGTWAAEPSSDPSSGRFRFGPIAAAGAPCPPPSMDESIVAQAQFVRSYLLKDGRLHLSLLADGGIYTWEPSSAEAVLEADVPFETKPDPDIEAAILRFSPSYERGVVGEGAQTARYVYSRVDLDGDDRNEVLVYLLGSIFCGTGGCDLLLLSESGEGYELVNRFPISRLPVLISDDRTAGWNDLVRLESGGGLPASYVRHTFDGKKYVYAERMPASTPPQGKRCLTGDLSFEDAIPLKPGD